MTTPHLFWATVDLFDTKAIAWWYAETFVEETPPADQLDTAFTVICINRSDGLGLAQALFTELDGLPEEMYLGDRAHIPPEKKIDYPEVFQKYLVMRGADKESGRWHGPDVKPYQTARLEEIDRFIERTGLTPLP